MKRKSNFLIPFLVGGVLMAVSCTDQFEDVQPDTSLAVVSEENASTNKMTTTEITFTARAMILECHGENIEFTGIIQNRVKNTESASGNTHYIRQFTVKGMTGKGFIGIDVNGRPIYTGTEYDVIGGAEMFNIKDPVYNADGSLNLAASIASSDIVIHRGNLVFVNREDGTRVIARHIITKVPGAGLKENTWECAGE